MSTRGILEINVKGITTIHYIRSDAYPSFAKDVFEKTVKEWNNRAGSYWNEKNFIIVANGIAGFDWISLEEYQPDDIDTEYTYIEHKWFVSVDVTNHAMVIEEVCYAKKRRTYMNKKWNTDPLLIAYKKQIKVKRHTRRR